MSKKYSFSDYDKYVALKPDLGFWLVIIYFLRPFILLITSFQMGRGARNANVGILKEMVYPDDFSFFVGCLAALPVIPVILAYIKRKPKAPDFIKKLWSNGTRLLTATAILNIIILFVSRANETFYHLSTPGWVQLFIAVSIIIFLNTSQRLKDTFADFP